MFIKGTPNMGISNLWPELHRYEWEGELMQFRRQRVAIDMTCMMRNALHGCVTVKSAAVVKYMSSKFADSDDSDFANSSSTINAREENALSSESPSSDSRTSTGAELPPMRSIVLFDEAHLLSVVKTKMSSIHNCGVFEVCVFDGCAAPMKSWKHQERAHKRRVAYENGMAKLEELYLLERRRLDEKIEFCAQITSDLNLEEGAVKQRVTHIVLPQKHELFKEAMKFFEKALYISPELTQTVIEPLKERTVECIVAPYEAAAQMAYLCREGYVAAAASEDSDLIAYYCPCVISKLDTFTGRCEVLQPPTCAPQFFRAIAAATAGASTSSSNNANAVAHGSGGASVHARMRAAVASSLHSSPQSPYSGSLDGPAEEAAKGGTAFTYESFLLGCIMAGCDYVANLRNIGIKKAFKLVAHATSLRQVLQVLETEYGFPVDELARYRQRLLESFYCFAHHLVYCPLRQEIVTYHPLPTAAGGSGRDALKTQLVGNKWDAQTAQDVCARCLSDPCTLRLYRGDYQSCVTRYLQRTRRGQTSLKAYTGFEEMTSNRVVVHLGSGRRGGDANSTAEAVGVKRERTNGSVTVVKQEDGHGNDHVGFGAPLKKRHVASGFLGTTNRAGGSGGGGAESQPLRAGEDVVVVRSRYFLMRGRTAVCERWSASDDDDGEEGSDGGQRTQDGDNSHGGSTSGGFLSEMGMTTSSVTAAAAAVGECDALTGLQGDTLPVGAGTHHRLGLARRPRQLQPLASPSPSSFSVVNGGPGPLDNSTSSGEDAAVGVAGVEATEVSTGPTASPPSSHDKAEPNSGVRGGAFGNSTCGMGEGTPSSEAVTEREGNDQHAGKRPCHGCAPSTTSTLTDNSGGESCVNVKTADGTVSTQTTAQPIGSQDSSVFVAKCACPFGYWQCNRPHSVFESCFLGKQWSREDGPPAPTPRADVPVVKQTSTPSASPSSSGAVEAARVYSPRAFRPPRSTAFPSAPTTPASTAHDSGEEATPAEDVGSVLHTRAMNKNDTNSNAVTSLDAAKSVKGATSSQLPSHRAAVRSAIFDTMTFKKTSS